MNTARVRTWAALLAAILVLLGTVGAAVAVAATRGWGAASQQSPNAGASEHRFAGQWSMGSRMGRDGYGSPMLADRDDDSGSMMGAQSSGMGSMMRSGLTTMMRPGGGPMMGQDSCDEWSMLGPDSSGFASMMGTGWASSSAHQLLGAGPVTATQARQAAQRWLAGYAPSAQLSSQTAMPMGYRFLASENATLVAMIMVDDDTGTVTGRVRGPATAR